MEGGGGIGRGFRIVLGMVYQNYSIMPRTSRNRVQRCTRHEFSLVPLAQQHKHPLHLALSFCLHSDKPPSKPSSSSSSCLQAPAFNSDSNYASPAFVLPCDQEYYRLRGRDMLSEHDLRFRGYTDEKTELMVVRPRSRNSYCNVCRVYYQDYLQHIGGKGHKYKVQSAEFTQHILQLQTVLEASRVREKERGREKEVSSVRETSVRASSVDENGEREEWKLEGLEGVSVKKVKTNQVLQDSHGKGNRPGSELSNRNGSSSINGGIAMGTNMNMGMAVNNSINMNSIMNNINMNSINTNISNIMNNNMNNNINNNHSIGRQVASSRAIEEQLMQEQRGRLIRMHSYQLQQLALSLNISNTILMSTLNCQPITLPSPHSSLHPLGPVPVAPVSYSGYPSSPFPFPYAPYAGSYAPFASSVGKTGYGFQKGQF